MKLHTANTCHFIYGLASHQVLSPEQSVDTTRSSRLSLVSPLFCALQCSPPEFSQLRAPIPVKGWLIPPDVTHGSLADPWRSWPGQPLSSSMLCALPMLTSSMLPSDMHPCLLHSGRQSPHCFSNVGLATAAGDAIQHLGLILHHQGVLHFGQHGAEGVSRPSCQSSCRPV